MVNITTPDGNAISNKALILVKMTPVTTGMGTLNRFPIQLDMNMRLRNILKWINVHDHINHEKQFFFSLSEIDRTHIMAITDCRQNW